MPEPIHLDHNATTRPAPEVVAAMREALESCWGNPSSVHRAGIEARQRVELARASVARLFGCRDREVVFTSGGTESASLAIRGTLEHFEDSPRQVLVTSGLEHSAVRECAERCAARGVEVCWLPHGSDGVVEIDALRELLAARSSEIALVSLMWANNETGVIAPVAEIGAICRERGVRFHCDAVQWAGRLPLDFSTLPVGSGPGNDAACPNLLRVGWLLVAGGVRLASQIVGGPHDRERRGGTQNVPGIVGLGVAAERARAEIAEGRWERIAALRDRFEREVLARCDGAVANASAAPRLPNTSNLGFPRLEAEAILVVLSERGVHASAGAACSSGSLDPSPVLLAMGLPREIAHGSVRFSLGPETTAEELDRSVDEIAGAIDRLSRSMI
ncbi:MAG: cysteine desulfurase family protein [Phycisphaerales bacterium]